MRYVPTAALIFLVGAAHNNLHKSVPEEMAGHVWSATGGVFDALLVALIAAAWRAWPVRLVCALLFGFAAQTAVCNGLYLIAPWPIVPGARSCSEGFGVPLASVGLWLTAVVAGYLNQRSDDYG